MAFAARKHDDGTWRLCKRMGATMTHVSSQYWPTAEVIFPSQAKAKACADELNETWWKTYEKASKNEYGKPSPHDPMLWEFVAIIQKHEGLSPAALKELGL